MTAPLRNYLSSTLYGVFIWIVYTYDAHAHLLPLSLPINLKFIKLMRNCRSICNDYYYHFIYVIINVFFRIASSIDENYYEFIDFSLAPIYWCRWRWSAWPAVLCQWNWHIFYTHCYNRVHFGRLVRLACTWKIAESPHCPMLVCAIHSVLYKDKHFIALINWIMSESECLVEKDDFRIYFLLCRTIAYCLSIIIVE